MRCKNASPSKCSICHEKSKCLVFYWFYRRNKSEYEKFLLEYSEKFPEKYELIGVIKMDKNKKQVLIIDAENKIVGHIDDINNLNNQKLQDLTDKRLVEVSGKEYEIILSLKQKEYIPYGQEQQKQSKNKQK